MSLTIGIIGLPNVGKSTLFNALLKKQQALVANYPFATIEPNVGVVPVKDHRLERLAEIEKEENKMDKLPPIIYATVSFVDIAGLVKGASVGEGLGNKFLSHIREVDAICQVVRFFKDTNITHVNGTANPDSDIETVNTELILADMQTLEKQQEPRKAPTKEDLARWQLVGRIKAGLDQGKLVRDMGFTDEELILIKPLQLLTSKPMFYVANVSENELSEKYPSNFIPISAKVEAELSDLSEGEQEEYLKELGVEESGLDKVVKKGYEVLNLISFLTAGDKEVRAWTINKGINAQMAAGAIHTDFVKKFIKAEVVSYPDFDSCGGWKKSRELGKARLEGRDYIVKDGDVIEFKIGA